MVNKINLDFSSSIKQIDELKSAAEAFGRTMQEILNVSSKFGGIINQSMTGANSAGLQSFSGSNTELLSSVRSRLDTNQSAISDFFKANPNAEHIGSGRYRMSGSSGSRFKDLGPLFSEKKELQAQEKDLLNARRTAALQGPVADAIRDKVEERQKEQGFQSGTNYNFSTMGYGMSDLPGVLARSNKLDGDGGGLKKISDTIRALEESGNKNSIVAATVLKDISKNLRDSQGQFEEAIRAFSDPSATSTPEKSRAATEKLIQTMANLDNTMQQATDAQKGARQLAGGGGGGGGDGPTIFGMPSGRFMRGANLAVAATGAAFGAVRFAQDASIGLGRAVYGGQVDKYMAEGNMADMRFKDVSASFDMTNVENIFRYRGDMLLGKNSRFLGPSGFQRALGVASDKQALELDLLRQERRRDITSSLGGAAVGGLEVLAGGAMTYFSGGLLGAAGLALMGKGMYDIAGGVKGATQSYLGSPYTQMSGELGTGLSGMYGSMMYGSGFSKMTRDKQEALMLQKQAEGYMTARQLQDSEMQRNRPLMAGYQEILSTIQAQQEGAVLVGEYAQRGQNTIEQRLRMYETPAQAYMRDRDRQLDIRTGMENKAESDMMMATMTGSTEGARYIQAKKNAGALSMTQQQTLNDARARGQVMMAERGYSDDLIKNSIMKIESGGQVKIKNPTSSAYGMFQFIKSTANSVGRRLGINDAYGQMTSLPESESRALQEKLFSSHYGDLVGAANRQKKIGAGQFLPKQVLVGLNQLGPVAVQKYLETGIDSTGGQIDPYITKMAKNLGVSIPPEFGQTISRLQSASSAGLSMPSAPSAGFDAGTISNYGATHGLSVHASLEMSSADFDRHANQVTNVLGGNRVATDAQTARMIRLGRSGLGDFSTQLGNVAGLNRAVGGGDNTGRLEQVLANAVAAGFDKSRTAQAFTQSAIQLAEQSGVTGIEGLAGTLRVAAGGMGLGGIADERSLRLATQGIGEYANYTAQKGTVTGIVGTIGAVQAGLGFGTGGGVAMGMSNPELLDAVEQLKSGNITNPKLQRMMRTSGKSKEELAASLQNVYASKSSVIGQILKNRGGLDVQGLLSDVKSGKMDFGTAFNTAMAQAEEAGSLSDIGAGGAMAYVSEQFRSAARTPEAKKIIDAKIKSSPFTDPAKQQMRSFIDSLTANASAGNRFGQGGVSGEERDLYFKSLEMGGQTMEITDGKFAGQAISKEAYEKGSAEFKSAADKELSNLSRLDLVRSTNYAAAAQNQNIQQVYITNFEDMLYVNLRSEQVKKNLNKD